MTPVHGRSPVEATPVVMHRSTRLWRLVVAFLVVVALAIAVRFARATETIADADARDASHAAKNVSPDTNHTTMGLPR